MATATTSARAGGLFSRTYAGRPPSQWCSLYRPSKPPGSSGTCLSAPFTLSEHRPLYAPAQALLLLLHEMRSTSFWRPTVLTLKKVPQFVKLVHVSYPIMQRS